MPIILEKTIFRCIQGCKLMGSLSSSIFIYLIFILLAFISGTVYWIRREFQVGAVLSFIFSLLAPLITVLVVAQRDTEIGVYDYIMEEVGAGNTWARLVVIIHIYLIIWVLFMLIRFGVKVSKSTLLREMIQKFISKIKEYQNKQKETKE